MKISKEEKVLRAFNALIYNCVDSIGLPKRPTAKQLHKAITERNEFEKYLKSKTN